MGPLTLAIIFATGFVIMTPVGPVSTICIRRSLIYGRSAGIAAGAGNAVAVATYSTIGVTGSTLITRFFTPFATAWHVAISVVLVVVAILLWRSRPMLPQMISQNRTSHISGFGATLALALANPADIVLFSALFTGLGIAIHTPLQHIIFYGVIFGGGLAYWIALASVLNRWRTGLTSTRIVLLNRVCATLMFGTAMLSIASLARTMN